MMACRVAAIAAISSNGTYNVAGAAYGPHACFGSVCDIDFAGAYAESGIASAQSRIAATF